VQTIEKFRDRGNLPRFERL